MIPTYKAKTTKGQEVIGLLTTNQLGNYCIKPENSDSPCVGEINPFTLKISIDGKRWHKIDYVQSALNLAEGIINE